MAQGVSIEDAEAAIWEQLDELKNDEVPAEEIEKVKNRFESEFHFRNLGGENLAGNLAIAELRGDAHLHLQEVERYRAVTAADVRSAAKSCSAGGTARCYTIDAKSKMLFIAQSSAIVCRRAGVRLSV